jgi:hypothetical protein
MDSIHKMHKPIFQKKSKRDYMKHVGHRPPFLIWLLELEIILSSFLI